eukprot:g5608.t1
MWSRAFGNWFGSSPSFPKRDTRQRSQKQNSASKSSSSRTPAPSSITDPATRGWWSQASSNFTTAIAGLGTSIKNAIPSNFELPVKVDVDLIRPSLQSMRDATLEFWTDLTPATRVTAMCVGSAMLSALFVRSLATRELKKELEKNAGLQSEVNALIEEKKSSTDAFFADGVSSVSQLTEAIAKATTAASQAAETAAVAAETCALQSRRAIRKTE